MQSPRRETDHRAAESKRRSLRSKV
jgi:hypothetical protein